MRFLAETEKAYFDEMYAFLKKELGFKGLVAGTIVFGPLGLYAQSGMDYIDGHAYWQHPRFPGRPWDPANWTVEQKAMVDHPDESPLFRLAAQRLAGKPYTVSEYNHPAPNDFQAECVPMIASFAAAQDWDGVWLYSYCHRTDDWHRRHFDSFFDVDANPAKWGFVPAGAVIFREGLAKPSASARTVSLARTADPLGDLSLLHLRHNGDIRKAVFAIEKADCEEAKKKGAAKKPFMGKYPSDLLADWYNMNDLRAAVALRGASRSVEGKPVGGLFGPAEPVAGWWAPPVEGTHGLYHTGFVHIGSSNPGAGNKASFRVLKPSFVAFAYAVLSERKILITACGRSENTAMKFSRDRRTVGRNWGGPPVMIEPVTLEWDFQYEGKWRCQALGPDGRPKAEVPFDNKGVEGLTILKLSPKYRTMWYLLTRE